MYKGLLNHLIPTAQELSNPVDDLGDGEVEENKADEEYQATREDGKDREAGGSVGKASRHNVLNNCS